MATKWQMKDLSGDGNVLRLECIKVDVLDVTLCYSFARCYHWGKMGKQLMGSLLPLCLISYNCQ